MKKTFVFFGLAAMLSIVACNKETPSQPEQMDTKESVLTLDITRGDDATKTTISYNNENGTLLSRWAKGDYIYVFNLTTGEQMGRLAIDESTIVNEETLSKASFKGSVTGLSSTSEQVGFLYPGKMDSFPETLSLTEKQFSVDLAYASSVSALAKYDIAYKKGAVQKAGNDQYSAAITLENKMAFGYFSTESVSTSDLKAQIATTVKINVADGSITAVKSAAGMSIPTGKTFYLPLVCPTGSTPIDISCGRIFPDGTGEDAGYKMVSQVKQETSFAASPGYYYRMSKYNDPAYGPIAFTETLSRYNTLAQTNYNIADSGQAPKNVQFLEGNLQWLGSLAGDKHWQVASSQFEVIKTTGSWNASNVSNYLALDQDLDLFGWGSVPVADKGFLSSTTNGDYSWGISAANKKLSEATDGVTHDWAKIFNDASSDSDKLYADINSSTVYPKADGKKYTVLSQAEWTNIFKNHWFAPVTVTDEYWPNGNNVVGLVVFPDGFDFATKATGVTKKYKIKADAAANKSTIADSKTDDSATVDEFQYVSNKITKDIINNNGILFLPAAGARNGAGLSNFGARGYYWSSVSSSATNAYLVLFSAANFNAQSSSFRYNGFSVRLAVASE